MPHDASVTVIIAAYNAEKTIEKAINSALIQDCISEVIVVDDASTDGTVGVVKSLQKNNNDLILLEEEKNSGPSLARNKAINISKGEWITILDSDDFLLADRIKKMLVHTDLYDIIADDLFQVSEFNIDGDRDTLVHPPLSQAKDISLEEFILSNVTREGRTRGELGFIKPLIRKSFLDDHGVRYQEHMRLGEDYEIYTRLLALGARMVLLPAQGYISVKRENSLSGQHSIEDLKCLRDCNTTIKNQLDLSRAEIKALRCHYIAMDCRYQWRVLIEAAKQRNIIRSIKTFLRPWPVPLYLIKNLFEQAVIRSTRRAR